MNTLTDFAYAAGYIDGDGCFHIRKQIFKGKKQPKYSSRLIITSNTMGNLKWFKKTFPGVIRNTKKPENLSHHKPVYQFIFKSSDVVSCVQQIIPFLAEKKDEAEIFLKFIKAKSVVEKNHFIERIYSKKNLENLVFPEHKKLLEDTRSTIKPTESDFAYLAGFIDAECCLGMQRYMTKGKPNPLFKIQLQCNNTKFPTFAWLLPRFGGQVHFIDRHSKNTKFRNQLTWRLSSDSLSKILPKILPYLKHKKPVCKELIKFSKTIIPTKGIISRNSPEFEAFYESILFQREQIFHQIQSLNRKGVII